MNTSNYKTPITIEDIQKKALHYWMPVIELVEAAILEAAEKGQTSVEIRLEQSSNVVIHYFTKKGFEILNTPYCNNKILLISWI